jgi:seryl-tRNA synthetase
MFDLKAIRNNPDSFDMAWARRGLDAQTPTILDLDERWRATRTELQEAQHARKQKSKEIGELKKKGEDPEALMNEVAELKNRIAELETSEQELEQQLNDYLARLPNVLSEDVPDGEDEDDNALVYSWGKPRDGRNIPDHADIGEALGQMDFAAAAKLSGARFTLLYDDLARLERALARYMLDVQTQQNGYREVSPPLLVREDVMYGTGQLPKFGEDLFKTTDERWLIPTAEVVLANIVREEILHPDQLPMRLTAFTPCFRAEAGAAGKDTRGMIRQHQFYKVELVSITEPEKSWDEHERMTRCARDILEGLELPYRQVTLCTGDTGGAAAKTYDLEVWLPGQGTYREISSCSNCLDYQARRMNARYRPEAQGETRYVHTLNGSGQAVGRALVAVVENYYDESDGGVFVPEVLRPYMNGLEKIRPITHNSSGGHVVQSA